MLFAFERPLAPHAPGSGFGCVHLHFHIRPAWLHRTAARQFLVRVAALRLLLHLRTCAAYTRCWTRRRFTATLPDFPRRFGFCRARRGVRYGFRATRVGLTPDTRRTVPHCRLCCRFWFRADTTRSCSHAPPHLPGFALHLVYYWLTFLT